MTSPSGYPLQAAQRYVFLGGGNMASAMIGGLIAQGILPERITVVAPSDASRQRLCSQFRVTVRALPDTAWHATDVMVLAVKPQQLREALLALRPWLSGQLIVSLVAGVRIATLSEMLGTSRVVRAMPNVAARAGHGMTGLLASPDLELDDRTTATSLALAVGRCMWVDCEGQLDAVTAISGSGPAYFFYLLEAMEDAALALGLSPSQGRALAAEALQGAAGLARASDAPNAALRKEVTSKGGTTEAAIRVLDELGTKDIFMRAIQAAAQQSWAIGANVPA